MNARPDEGPPPTGLIWSCVEAGFYVASDANSFLGFIDRVATDVFQVCDANAQQVGMFRTLEAAQDFLTAGINEHTEPQEKGLASWRTT